jgi:hypothetical protein
MRLCSQDILGTDAGQLIIIGMPARLCLARRNRSLMANLVER